MPRRCRRGPLAHTRATALHSSLYALARLGPQQPDDQVKPVHLTPCVLEVEIRPRPDVLQASMLLGVEQAVDVEGRCPLVLGLQDSLSIVQADPPDVLGELAVGSHQILCGGAQPTVGRVNLLDERVVSHRRLLSGGLLAPRFSPRLCSPPKAVLSLP